MFPSRMDPVDLDCIGIQNMLLYLILALEIAFVKTNYNDKTMIMFSYEKFLLLNTPIPS